MKKTSRIGSAASNPRRWQRNGLAAASLMALASFAMGQSANMSIVYGTTSPVVQTTATGAGVPWSYSNALGQVQTATSAVSSTPSTLTMGVNQTGTGSSAASITQQVIQTLTRVNVLTPAVASGRTIDLGLINTGDNNIGYALQSSSGTISAGPPVAVNSQTMTSSLTTAVVELSQSGYASSLRSLDNNQISAVAQANTAQLVASGTLAGTYSSSTDGSATATYSAAGIATASVAGGAVLNTVQGANNVNALASVNGGTVQMVIAKSSGNLTDGLSQSGNRISATTNGNTSTNLFQASSASASWTGSALVANAQSGARTATNTSEYLSTLTNGVVLANIKEADVATPTNVTILGGSLSQVGNTVDSTVVVNNAGARANNGTVSAAGNVIQFDSGASVTGAGTNASVSTAAASTTVAADLAVLNVQSANALSLTASAVKSGAGDLQIAVAADQMNSNGSITQTGNLITARAVPNLAGNLVSVGQTTQASAMTASVSATNLQQTNSSTSIQGLLTNGEILLEVGSAATTPTTNGSATSSGNIVSALADANIAATSVLAKASNMAVSGSLDWTGSPVKGITMGLPSGTGANTVVSNMGVTAVNQQSSSTSVISATNSAGLVQLTTAGGASNSYVPVQDFNGTLDANTVSAAASANTGSTGVVLQGATAPSLTAAVGNSQTTTVDANKSITAVAGATSGKQLDITLQTGNATSSRLVVTNNALESTASANRASNSLATTMSTQVTGHASGTASLSAPADGLSVSALGDLTVANAQYLSAAAADSSTSKLSATTLGNIQMSALVVSGSGSTLNFSGNRVASAVSMNQAGNANTLSAADASAISLGLLSDQVAINAWGEATTSGNQITSQTTSLASTNATFNKNTVNAAVNANAATHALSSSTSSISGRTLSLAAGLSSGNVTAVADMSLLNNQVATNIKMLSTLTTASSSEAINVTTGAVTSASNITVNQNNVTASAEANTATNQLTQASSVSSTVSSALVSRQDMTRTSTVNTIGANLNDQVLVSTAAITASNLQVNENKVAASALGNYGVNSSNLSGMTLARSTPATLAINSSTGLVTADNALVNLQASTLYTVDSDNLGKVSLSSSGAVTGGSSVALSGNQLNATSQLNYADNRQLLNYTSALTGATQGLLSKQVATTSNATADLTTGSTQALSVLSVSGSTVQLNNNTADVAAGMNSAFNTIGLTASNMTAPKSLLNNLQSVANGASDTVAATLVDTIQLDVTSTAASASVSTGVLNVLDNAIRGQSLGNMAINTLSLSGGQIAGSGTGGVNSANAATSTADLGTISVQTAVGSAYTATTTGDVKLTTNGSGTVASNSRLSLNDNTVSSAVQVNTVTNTQTAAFSSAINASPMGIASSQSASTGATVTATTTATQKIDLSSSVTGSNLEVSGNTSSSTALVNLATNSISLGGATSTSGALITGSNLTSALSATMSGTVSVGVTADVGIANYQSTTDKNPTSVLKTEIGIDSGTVAATAGATPVYSQLSVSNNIANSVAQANAATNDVSLRATTMGSTTAGISNAQTANTTVSASLTPLVTGGLTGVIRMDLGAGGTVSGANLLMSGNELTSAASMNDATNRLAVSGTTLIGTGTAYTSLASLTDTAMSKMDFGLLNVQSGTGAVSASLDPGNSTIYSLVLGGTLNTLMTVRDNNLAAQGVVNNASNQITLGATGDLQASAVLKNLQTATSSVTATLGGTSGTVKFGMEADNVAAGSTSTFNMENNTFRAQAGANNASNVLNAVGGTQVNGSGTGTASANNFAILNNQDAGTGAITARVQNLSVGADLTSTNAGTVNIAMTGNQIVALAYGNLVSNTIGMKTLAQGLENTGVTVNSKQNSTATLSAQISGVNMSVTTSGGSVGGSVAMSGNSITSQVVANQASVGMVAR